MIIGLYERRPQHIPKASSDATMDGNAAADVTNKSSAYLLLLDTCWCLHCISHLDET